MKICARMMAVLLLTATTACAAEPDKSVTWLDDMSAAKAEARKSGKAILADFTGSDWCGWCIKLDKEVFSQKAFLDYASSSLVLFKADYPRKTKLSAAVVKQNKALLITYRVEGFPTVLLLDAEGAVLAQTGYRQGGAEAYVDSLKGSLAKAGWTPAAVGVTIPPEKAGAAPGAAVPAAK
ncbi:MAG: thioredoxin family protein [bacterium]